MSIEEIQAGTFVGFFDTPPEVYYAAPYLSNSYLSNAAGKTFAHAEAMKSNPMEQTADMRKGWLIHMALLEPERAKEKFFIIPKLDMRTPANKVLKQKYIDDNKDKVIVDEEELELVNKVMATVMDNPEVALYFKGGKSEQSFYWRDEDSGVMMKARADYIMKDGTIVDLKTCESAAMVDVQRDIAKRGYYRQAAIYLDGLVAATGFYSENFYIVAVEKTKNSPYLGVATYRMDQGLIEQGRMEYKRLLQQYAEHKKHGKFPGYKRGLQSMGLPNWKINENLMGEEGI